MRSVSIVVVSLLLVVACSKDGPASSSTAPPGVNTVAAPTERAAPPQTPSTQASSTHAVAMLDAYERVRALLAADQLEGVAAAAREIGTAATAATSDQPNGVHFTAIATNAATLAAATDIAPARAAFGEISRHLVALLAHDKMLAAGKHVFECPMAKGYKKWVQVSDALENPYMGKRMLHCGGESSWE